jgi:integrase/recombinase XerD
MKKTNYSEICKQKLEYLKYSDNTVKNYMYHINMFLSNTKTYPTDLNSKDFQSYLDNYRFTSISQQNQVINAIRFLYKYGLERKYDKVSFKRPKKEKTLPRVIDSSFLKKKIENIVNSKHKAILCLGFSCGMRVSEVCSLKIEDIDSSRMLITIRQSKGRKDRVVPLSEYVLNVLRNYYKKYQPKEYLFNGQFQLKYSHTSCNQIVKKYLGEQYHFHLLRHSCFTALLESGTDIRVIQKIAGHSSSKTTEIYTHVSNHVLSKVNLPI